MELPPLIGETPTGSPQLVKSLLRPVSGSDLLEVGYGSGVFCPELPKTCSRISGIDPQIKDRVVVESLKIAKIEADLRSGRVSDMLFESDSFDAVVAVSAREYVGDIGDAWKEITRVLKPGGKPVIVTPCKSPLLDAGLRLFGDEDAASNYGERHEHLLEALDRHFDTEALKRWQWPGIPWFTVYRALGWYRKPSVPG